MPKHVFAARTTAGSGRGRTRVLPVVVTVGMLGVGSLLGAPGAAAATASGPVSNCHATATGANCTVTYTYTGAEQTFSIPPDMSGLTVRLTGANGGAIDSSGGGLGATVTVTPTLAADQKTLYLEVGGNGGTGGYGYSDAQFCASGPDTGVPGGFNGGAAATTFDDVYRNYNGYCALGGSGGGATDIRTSPSSAGDSLSTRLAVAGGGGGAGYGAPGGNAGQDGQSTQSAFPAGKAGQSTAGGAGSNYSSSGLGSAGRLGVGGTGIYFGGGGGGGLYGGGGGFIAGAGGGSSLGTVTGTSAAASSVVLTYNSPSTLLTTLPLPPLPGLPALPALLVTPPGLTPHH